MKKTFFTIMTIVLISGMIATGCAKKAVKSEMAGEGAEVAPKAETAMQETPKPAIGEATPQKGEAIESEQISRGEAAKKAEPVVEVKGIGDIFFDFDRSFIREDARPTLEDNAKYLKANVNIRVTIEGHCDERGTSEYNIALGERRAQSAKRYLTDMGMDPSRISTVSYGEEKPFCGEHNEQCWQENRRAHFVEK